MVGGAIKFTVATLFILALCGGCRPKQVQKLEPSTSQMVQTIEISNERLASGLRDTLRFGVMRQGEVIEKSLRITNCDKEPFVILRYVTSCGCVSVNYNRKPILMGECSDVKFTFDSKSLNGWQMKLMEFYFADKDTPLKIYLEAEVE